MKVCEIHGTPLNGVGDCFVCQHPEASEALKNPTRPGEPQTFEEWESLQDSAVTLDEEAAWNAGYYTGRTSLRAELARVQGELERDRTKVAECVTAADKALHNYQWLIEGRGSYEWDDDRWHKEFEAACENIRTAISPMIAIAADWSNCPKTWEEVQKARNDENSEMHRKLEAVRRYSIERLDPSDRNEILTILGADPKEGT